MAYEEKCFTFTWKLENVSFCLEKMGAFIRSPIFVADTIDETKWFLAIYPRGEEYENYIGFYLYRDSDRKGTSPKEIKYELTFIAGDGSVFESCTDKFDFVEADGHGFPQFMKREELFNFNLSSILPQDTLTARCRIWRCVGDMAEDIRCFARTRIGIHKRTFVWKVKNFSTIDSGEKFTYEMKSVDHDKQLMSINLYLAEELDSEKIIRFELIHQDQATKFSTLQLSLIDASGNKVSCNQAEFWFNDRSKRTEFQLFFTKNKLMEMKYSYLPNDILSLHWEWTFSKGVISNEIEDFQYVCTSSDSIPSNTHKENVQKVMPLSYSLNENFKSLYDENFLCDVKLKTNTAEFPAHKIVLSASSSVFKAMFSRDMKEKDSNCVNIEDLDDDTIRLMLLYIYTTRVENITWENASHLYSAADKYAIMSLKNVCSSHMKDNLTPNNACEVLLLSDLHADGDLKTAVQGYIIKHIKEVVNSDEWKLLMETNAKLAAETVCLQYK